MKLITKVLLLTICLAATFSLTTEVSRRNMDISNLKNIIVKVEDKCGTFEGSNIDKEELINEVYAAFNQFKAIQLDQEEQELVDEISSVLFPESKVTKIYNKFKDTIFSGIGYIWKKTSSAASAIKNGAQNLFSKKLRKSEDKNDETIKHLMESIIRVLKKDPKFAHLIEYIEKSENIGNFIDVLGECYFKQEGGEIARKYRKGFFGKIFTTAGNLANKVVTSVNEFARDSLILQPLIIPLVFIVIFGIMGNPLNTLYISAFIATIILEIFIYSTIWVGTELIIKLRDVLQIAKKFIKKIKNKN